MTEHLTTKQRSVVCIIIVIIYSYALFNIQFTWSLANVSYFSNPTLHRHLAPLRTDFTDTRTALQFFFCFSFFLVFSYRYFLPFKVFLSWVSYISHNRLFLDFLFFYFHLKHFKFFFSSCARLNWQLACQFSSANHLSYRIVLSLSVNQSVNVCHRVAAELLDFGLWWYKICRFNKMQCSLDENRKISLIIVYTVWNKWVFELLSSVTCCMIRAVAYFFVYFHFLYDVQWSLIN